MKTIEVIDNQPGFPKRDRYYYTDAEEILGLGRTAVNSRRNAANIIPYTDESSQEAYFDYEQMGELIKCHKFTQTGGKLASYQGRYSAKGNAIALNQAQETNLSLVPDHKNSIWCDLIRNAKDELLMNPTVKKHVRLEAYLQLGQPITDSDCVEILGFKPPRTGFRDYYFQFNFIGWDYYEADKKACRQKLWQLIKVDLEAEAQAKLAAKQQRKLEAEATVIEQGDQHYQAVKEMIHDG